MKKILLMTMVLCMAVVTNVAGQSKNREERRQERQERQKEFCDFMDSLIRGGVYVFTPDSFEIQPAGSTHNISNPNLRMEVRQNEIDIHLPNVVGLMPPYGITVMNYTLTDIDKYKSVQSEDGSQWVVTFSTDMIGSQTHNFRMEVTTCTGYVTLYMSSDGNNTIAYYGSLSKLY